MIIDGTIVRGNKSKLIGCLDGILDGVDSDKLEGGCDGGDDKVLDESALDSVGGEKLGILDILDENESDDFRMGCKDGKLDDSVLEMIDGIIVGFNDSNFVGILDGGFETISVGELVGCLDGRLGRSFVGISLNIDDGIEVKTK